MPRPASRSGRRPPLVEASRAARAIRAAAPGVVPEVAVILGSGWADAASLIGSPEVELPVRRLPGFAAVEVPGQRGLLRIVRTAGGRRVLVLLGRTHLYEGHGVDAVVHPVRTAAALGCGTVVLTNAAGSLRPEWAPGQPVLISDHLNLSGESPLSGPAFVDLTDLYAAHLRAASRLVDPGLPEGVYAQFRGPQYETPAEIRMAGALGADLVGMSTAVEAIAARACGMDVLGLALVTNAAAGTLAEPLVHEEVLAAGRRATPRLGELLAGVVERI